MHRGAVFALVTGIAFASACSDSEPAAQRGHPLAAAGTSNTAGRPPHGSGGTSTEGGDAGGPSSTGATAGGGARAAEDSGTGKAGAKSHSSHPTPSGDDDDDTATGGTSNPPGSGGSATATAGEAASGEGGEPHDGGTSGSPHAGGTSGEPNDSGGWNTSGGPGSGTGGSSGTGGAASGAGGSGTAGAGEVSGAGGVSGSGATNLGGSGSVGTVNGQGPDCTDELDLPIVTKEPATLFDTGLYATADAAPDEVAPYVAPYTPRYALWSDGAEKTRYAYVPRCSTIDASDMDHWQFPVGTRFWKEFRVPEAGNALVETRFILRYGPGPNDWLFAAYQWPENAQHASDAKYVTAPVPDASGTTHDIPGPDDCTRCHTHEPERILGFGAIELSHSLGGLDIRTLSDNGWLNPPTASTFSPPGDATAQAALGYVHANCGPCHNENFDVGGDTPPRMRLSVFDAALADTGFYQTLLDVPTYNSDFAGIARVEPCDAANSEIIMRMSSRPVNQMPPFATEVADQTGIATVSAFINALPAPGHACGH